MSDLKIALVIDPFYQGNQMFNELNTVVNRDDCQRPWIELRNELANINIELDTVDITPIQSANIVMFINVHTESDIYFQKALEQQKTIFCFITELDLIHKNNSNKKLIAYFDKIFTYQSNILDHQKIFKINYSFDFVKKYADLNFIDFDDREKSYTLIAGNKRLDHRNELYSKRVEVIRWFEEKHLNEFDLYGIGWNRRLVFNRFALNYNSLGYFSRFLPDNYKSYKGRIVEKSEILKKYKFSFCFENALDERGWITEKIFDSLFNGCIPIYLGASEIGDVIPPSCYIHMRDFNSYDELYEFTNNMTRDEYNTYLKNIKLFIEEKAKDTDFEFCIPYFVKTIKNQILKTIKDD